MNAPPLSRDFLNPFAMADQATLADVQDRLPDSTLSANQKRDCRSALNRLSAIAHEPLSLIPADPAAIRERLERARPTLSALSPKTQANMRSCILTALEAT